MPTPRQIERRQRVLRISREFFAQHGFQETTLDQIAKKARIGKGIIYRYFGNKEDLLVAVFTDTFENIQAAARDFPVPVAPTVEDRFRFIIRNLLQNIESQRETFAFFGKILLGLPGTPWGLGVRKEFIEKYIEISMRRTPALTEEMKNGNLITMDPEKLLFLIIGATYGVVAWWVRKGCPPGLVDEVDSISEVVLNGILTGKSRSRSGIQITGGLGGGTR